MNEPDPCTAARTAYVRLKRERAKLLGDLGDLVQLESPSTDPISLRRTADHLTQWFDGLGQVSAIQGGAGAPHIRIDVGEVIARRHTLVLCHYDTVWEVGTVQRRPFSVEEDSASGPGVLDMKASIVLVHAALQTLKRQGIAVPGGIRLLITADEEIGSPTSARLIEQLAREAAQVLVMEPPLADGRLKTSRKGYARVRFDIEGRAAHAGIEPEAGVSASVEAASLVLFADALKEGPTSINVGLLRSGSAANVIPAHAALTVDVRAGTRVHMDEILGTLRGYRPRAPEARIHMVIEDAREPLERLPDMDPLIASAQRIGSALGVPINEGHTGGGSDGNLAQAAGAATLDGLGVVGTGPHREDERIRISSLIERAALHAGMLLDLGQAAQ